MSNKRPIAVTVTAIVAITVLEAIALLKNIDGTLMATVVAAIAGLGGYTLGQVMKQRGE